MLSVSCHLKVPLTMDFNNLSEREIVSCHLNLLQKLDENTIVFSSLVGALRDARQNTGRDLKTGENPDRYHNPCMDNWLGATCYLIILEQFGKCYKGKYDPKFSDLSPIQKCLLYHTKLSSFERDAIYALRNAFAHDYSISNVNRKYPSLRHHFTLLGYYTDPMIKLPNSIWDGNPETKTRDNMTYIGLPWIGEVAETIYDSLLYLHNNNELTVTLPGGSREIRNRYLLFNYKEKNPKQPKM